MLVKPIANCGVAILGGTAGSIWRPQPILRRRTRASRCLGGMPAAASRRAYPRGKNDEGSRIFFSKKG